MFASESLTLGLLLKSDVYKRQALRGAGDTRFTLFVSLIGACGIRVCLTLIFINVMGMGLEGAWIAMAVDWTVRSTLMVLRWRSGKWKEIRV